MNQKELKYPHSFENRKPVLHDGVLFVPDFYVGHQNFDMPPLSQIFNNSNPARIEYCSGNGEWIVQKAKENPNINWFAVEKKFRRVRKIWVKAHQMGLTNLVVVCGDANDFIRYYLKEGEIEGVYINFPDPWPKEKHAKYRLVQFDFVKEMHRTMKEGAEAIIVTDDADYSLQVIDEMRVHFTSLFPEPFYAEKGEEYGSSYFNRLFAERGKLIRMMQFKKEA